MSCSLFICSTVTEHLDCFQLDILSKVAWTLLNESFYEYLFSSTLDNTPEWNWWIIRISVWLIQTFLLAACDSLFVPYSCQHLLLSFIFSKLSDYGIVYYYGFNLYFPHDWCLWPTLHVLSGLLCIFLAKCLFKCLPFLSILIVLCYWLVVL